MRWYKTVEENCIWNNKTLKVGGKSVYNEWLMASGMWIISDLFDKNGILIPFNTWLKRGAVELDRLVWYGIRNTLKKNGIVYLEMQTMLLLQ